MANEESTTYIDDDGNLVTKAAVGLVFEPAPPGPYIMRIDNIEVKEGQKAPYLAVELLMVNPLDGSAPEEEWATLKVFENVSFKANWKITELAVALGLLAEEDVVPGEPVSLNVFDAFGSILAVQLAQEVVAQGPNVGKIRNVVSKFLPHSLVVPSAPAPAAAKPKAGKAAAKAETEKAPAPRRRR